MANRKTQKKKNKKQGKQNLTFEELLKLSKGERK